MSTVSDPSPMRPLGRTGMRIYPISYGMWRFAGTKVEDAQAKLEAALDVGINFFDTADIYGYTGDGGFGDAEVLLGQVFAAAPGLRDRMILATKGGVDVGVPYNSGHDYLIAACEDSLRRMRTDYVDLYQIHRPDLLAHPEEIARALHTLYRAGKIRAVGISNYTTAQVDALAHYLDIPLASHQPEISAWHLAAFFDGTLDQCMRMQMTPMAWSPLAGGVLAMSLEDARQDDRDPRLAKLITCLDRLAESRNCDRTAILLGFLLAHPAGIVPIIGTQRIERIRSVGDALSVKLTHREWYEIIQTAMGKPLP